MVSEGVIAFGEGISRFPMTMPFADESPAASAAGDVFQEVELLHGSVQAVELGMFLLTLVQNSSDIYRSILVCWSQVEIIGADFYFTFMLNSRVHVWGG